MSNYEYLYELNVVLCEYVLIMRCTNRENKVIVYSQLELHRPSVESHVLRLIVIQ